MIWVWMFILFGLGGVAVEESSGKHGMVSEVESVLSFCGAEVCLPIPAVEDIDGRVQILPFMPEPRGGVATGGTLELSDGGSGRKALGFELRTVT